MKKLKIEDLRIESVCSRLGTGPCATYVYSRNGHTGCGTCASALSCDMAPGCGGTSFDLQPC